MFLSGTTPQPAAYCLPSAYPPALSASSDFRGAVGRGCVSQSADWVCRESSVRPPWRTYARRTYSRPAPSSFYVAHGGTTLRSRRGRSSVRPPWRTYAWRTYWRPASSPSYVAHGGTTLRSRRGRRYGAGADEVASAPRGGRIRGGRIGGRRRRHSTSPTGGRRYGAGAEEVASAPRGGRMRGGRMRGRRRLHSTSPTGGRRYGAGGRRYRARAAPDPPIRSHSIRRCGQNNT